MRRSGAGRPAHFERFAYPLTHERPLRVEISDAVRYAGTIYNIHPGLELGLLLRGRQEFLLPDFTFPVSAGDVWTAAMWEMHGVFCEGVRMRVVVLTFLPEFIGDVTLLGTSWLDLFSLPPKHRPHVRSDSMRRQAVELGEKIWEEAEQKTPGWEEAIRLHVLEVLLMLRRGWEPAQGLAEQSKKHSNNLQRLMPVLTAGYMSPCEDLSLAEAAERCGLSARHFWHLFRETMGVSFTQHHLRGRVAAAANLLLETDQSIETVAERTGFADGSHFHRNFVKRYGCTPAEYRRRFSRRA